MLPILAGLVAVAAAASAQPLAPIRYTVRFPAPQTNYLEVDATVPTEGRASVEMLMAVWTPGSYLVREYERNVEDVKAFDGTTVLTVEKPVKNRWRIATNGAAAIHLTYRVYSHEMTVRSNWVEADFAMINGAPTFMTIASDVAGPAGPAYTWPRQPLKRPHDVSIELPAAWKTSMTGMPEAPDGRPNHYLAPDFDTLVDSPIVAGNPAVHEFTVAGKRHFLVDVATGDADAVFDGTHAVRDLQRIVETDLTLWGALPYDKYVFFNVLTGGGGLEHKNSVMMMASQWATSTRERYVNWLSLASHEYFHLWNVKRLRPIELGPFDYERENYPRSLWISEGLTDYYADVQLARAGLITPGEYLKALSAAIRALQTTPGRLTQPVETASFDAWIKQYRPDENSVNSSISYYTKGAVLGFVLDARIRAATNDAKSLDDVMRLALARYSGARGFTPQDFRKTAGEVAGVDLAPWFHTALETTAEVDYAPALDWYGLEFGPSRWRDEDAARARLGATVSSTSGRLMVADVPRGTPAFDAGVNAGDEIVAIGGFRVVPDQYVARLEALRPGVDTAITVARHDALKTLTFRPVDPVPPMWELRARRGSSAVQQSHLTSWVTAVGPPFDRRGTPRSTAVRP
jgi:predicted metalloprotease with PDZ domain